MKRKNNFFFQRNFNFFEPNKKKKFFNEILNFMNQKIIFFSTKFQLF